MAFSLSHFYSKNGADQVDIADGGTGDTVICNVVVGV
jgi:hypothetical protein